MKVEIRINYDIIPPCLFAYFCGLLGIAIAVFVYSELVYVTLRILKTDGVFEF